jgi:hypothetical protein
MPEFAVLRMACLRRRKQPDERLQYLWGSVRLCLLEEELVESAAEHCMQRHAVVDRTRSSQG